MVRPGSYAPSRAPTYCAHVKWSVICLFYRGINYSPVSVGTNRFQAHPAEDVAPFLPTHSDYLPLLITRFDCNARNSPSVEAGSEFAKGDTQCNILRSVPPAEARGDGHQP